MKVKLLILVLVAIALAAGGVQLARRVDRPDVKAAELAAAITRAQSSLPKFRARLEHPEPGDEGFFIRVRFSNEGKAAEYLWMSRARTAGEGFKAILAEPPFFRKDIQKGDELTVKTADVVDWTIRRRGGTPEGNFTQGLEPHG